eukprot:8823974-Heterocapsa_arctica.AAC.1
MRVKRGSHASQIRVPCELSAYGTMPYQENNTGPICGYTRVPYGGPMRGHMRVHAGQTPVPCESNEGVLHTALCRMEKTLRVQCGPNAGPMWVQCGVPRGYMRVKCGSHASQMRAPCEFYAYGTMPYGENWTGPMRVKCGFHAGPRGVQR